MPASLTRLGVYISTPIRTLTAARSCRKDVRITGAIFQYYQGVASMCIVSNAARSQVSS